MNHSTGKLFAAAAIAYLAALVPLKAQDATQVDSLFGAKESGKASLIGIFYDLKQTQKGVPTDINNDEYVKIIAEFLKDDWDEIWLNRYFRAAKPVYATQVFIPHIGADSAPKAFGVEDIVEPSKWVIHYKGQVSPPADGVYRLAGYGDDVMAVAVNGKTVMMGSWMKSPLWPWTSTEPQGPYAGRGAHLTYGDWIALRKDEPVDLDILIGECPGNLFAAFVMYQRRGVNYPTDDGGSPILPILQLATYDTKDLGADLAPKVLETSELWTGFQ